ncbi:MAG: site-2 protease family protein [Pirellulaceae bacterium]|nr:site-2 protease family protein [Pirellulaceae bacterium]
MLGSTKLGKIGGITVRIHWTFWLLMIFYALSATASSGPVGGLMTALLVGLVFACVLAHEFGHAFAARAFGIPTHDITLLPIGGLARLARMPENPKQELLIALAGPAVNVVIALGLMLLLPLQSVAAIAGEPMLVLGGGLVENLLAANIVLVLFNMLPAFPMDGGRVLRSLIAMRTTHLRATEIAARVGRWMSLLFIMAGFFYGFELILVGLFVLLAGTGELFEARRRAMGTAAPFFQFQWSNSPNAAGNPWSQSSPHGTQVEWEYPGRSSSNASRYPDVIDAIEVREIKEINPSRLGNP